MSDTESENYEDEYDPEDDEAGDGTEGSTPTGAVTAFGRTYEPLPEGWVTAGGFAKVLKAQRNTEVKPQVIYATAKSSKTFPAIHHSDGRIVVEISKALEWWDAKEERVKSGTGGQPRSTEPTAYEKAQAAAAAKAQTESAAS